MPNLLIFAALAVTAVASGFLGLMVLFAVADNPAHEYQPPEHALRAPRRTRLIPAPHRR